MAKRRANGEGTIVKRKDGRFGVYYYVTYPDGTRQRKQKLCHTYEEAKTALHEVLTKADRGLLLYGNDIPLEKFYEKWINFFDPNNNKPSTVSCHKHYMEKKVLPILGKIPLKKLRVEHVQQMMIRLKKQGEGPRTIQLAHDSLASCLTQAMRLEYVEKNVARLAPKPQNKPRERSFWSKEQLQAFLIAAQSEPLYPLYLLLFRYGLRRGELTGIEWGDIDFDNNTIQIQHNIVYLRGKYIACTPKTATSTRILPLLPDVKEALLKYKETQAKYQHNDNLIFHNTRHTGPVEPHYMSCKLKEIATKIGIPPITIHEGRHTVATLMKDMNVQPKEAQMILGHSSIMTTLNIYTHSTIDSKLDALASIC